VADGLFNPSRLYEVLKQYGLLPKHANFSPAGEASGLFSADLNRLVAPDAKLVSRDQYSKDATMATLTHEMTHAVQNNLLQNTAIEIQQKKQKGAKLTDQEQQYLRAAEQIFSRQYGNIGSYNSANMRSDIKSYKNLTNDMFSSPTGNKNFESYRKFPDEAQAFGVGNMSYQSNLRGTGVNPHFDPSVTTEFDILLSMYQNLPESLKSSAATVKQGQIERSRQNTKDVYLDLSGDMLKNPFADTTR